MSHQNTKTKPILFLILLVLPIHTLKNDEVHVNRIAGGHPAHEAQFPYFAQLVLTYFANKTKDLSQACGGTLISQRWILTAAHCFPKDRKLIKNMERKGWALVFMGSNVKFDTKNAVRNEMSQIIIHYKYYMKQDPATGEATRVDNDVALGKLKKAYQLTRTIQLVHLPPQNFLPDGGTSRCKKGYILGVGQTHYDPPASAKVLQFANITVTTREHLKQRRQKPCVDTVFYTQAEFEKGHSLTGDSGGPYICYPKGKNIPVQYGIDSQGSSDNFGYKISTYEEVDQHMWFITHYVRDVKIYSDGKSYQQERKKPRMPIDNSDVHRVHSIDGDNQVKAKSGVSTRSSYFILSVCVLLFN